MGCQKWGEGRRRKEGRGEASLVEKVLRKVLAAEGQTRAWTGWVAGGQTKKKHQTVDHTQKRVDHTQNMGGLGSLGKVERGNLEKVGNKNHLPQG